MKKILTTLIGSILSLLFSNSYGQNLDIKKVEGYFILNGLGSCRFDHKSCFFAYFVQIDSSELRNVHSGCFQTEIGLTSSLIYFPYAYNTLKDNIVKHGYPQDSMLVHTRMGIEALINENPDSAKYGPVILYHGWMYVAETHLSMSHGAYPCDIKRNGVSQNDIVYNKNETLVFLPQKGFSLRFITKVRHE